MIDGVIRMLFLSDLLLLAVQDIRRVFEYHGAETSGFTWERGGALVENARTQPASTPRRDEFLLCDARRHRPLFVVSSLARLQHAVLVALMPSSPSSPTDHPPLR